MSTLIVLFNLKSSADQQAYEAWAKTTDIPTAGGLKSVDEFKVFKTAGVLMSEQAPPYQYVEIIQVNDMNQFGQDVATETMQKVAAEFQTFADQPIFMLTNEI